METKKKNNEIVFSVIIPVYNVENYLNRCVDSVLKQTYKDYEIILVDDGSTDQSLDICNGYSLKYPNIRTIHQNNKGVSAARNTGIAAAKGEYICFIDSDDFVDNHYLEKLSESDADLVICGFYDFLDGKIIKTIPNVNSQYLLDNDDSLIKYLNGVGSVFVWGRRLKKSIIQMNKISFDEKMKFSEDIVFENRYILNSHTVETIDYQGYYHCQYDTYKTLSSKASEAPFLEKNYFRKIAYNQFLGHKKVQAIYVENTLYFTELEFVKIAKSKETLDKKKKEIKSILDDDFIKMCIDLSNGILPKDTVFFCKHKIIFALLLKYRRSK